MTEGRSEDFKKHFLVTHFFNPVRYMRLLELVAGEHTSPEVIDFIADFGRFRLGKGIVYGKDTPNFIGNRIGAFGIVATFHAMMEMDYQVDEVDAITGPAIGHPSSASFGTVDLVGLDVLAHVINTLKEGCPDDEQRELFEIPGLHEEDDRRWGPRPEDQGRRRLLPDGQGSGRRARPSSSSTGRPASIAPRSGRASRRSARPRRPTTSRPGCATSSRPRTAPARSRGV